jgi:C-terminal processing protease CtpA/Prc
VDKLVIDLRNNSGGNSGIMDPLIDELAQNKKINKEGSLFVIIGRQTFSSAILNAIDLKNKTKAILVGEPTGGKPNHFGEIKTLKLPNTHSVVTYSTKYFTHATEDTPSLMPDILIELYFRDYLGKQDPFLEAVWGKTP